MKIFFSIFSFLHCLFFPIYGGEYTAPPQQCEINVESAGLYIDQCNHFTVAYGKNLKPEFQSDDRGKIIIFNGDKDWVITLSIENTDFSTMGDWMNAYNKSPLDGSVLMNGKELHDGINFYSLQVPLNSDLQPNGQPYYQKEVAFIKNKQFYTFTLHSFLDPSYEKEFDSMVGTFHFYDEWRKFLNI